MAEAEAVLATIRKKLVDQESFEVSVLKPYEVRFIWQFLVRQRSLFSTLLTCQYVNGMPDQAILVSLDEVMKWCEGFEQGFNQSALFEILQQQAKGGQGDMQIPIVKIAAKYKELRPRLTMEIELDGVELGLEESVVPERWQEYLVIEQIGFSVK
ncbi:MAG: hypothetical protein AAGD25_37225 [Cyanobacteria bacterium P01_F01_bin.150]